MGQQAVAPVQIHVVYLKVTVGMMTIVLALSYVEQITVTLHFFHMLTAAIINPYQVSIFIKQTRH